MQERLNSSLLCLIFYTYPLKALSYICFMVRSRRERDNLAESAFIRILRGKPFACTESRGVYSLGCFRCEEGSQRKRCWFKNMSLKKNQEQENWAEQFMSRVTNAYLQVYPCCPLLFGAEEKSVSLESGHIKW